MGANGGHPERTLDRKAVRRLAEALVAAEAGAKPIPPLTKRHRALSPADAYAIQFAAADLQREAGRRQVGWKVALTSRATREQFGLREPELGHLLAPRAEAEGGHVALAPFIRVKVETEIAFVLGADLEGPGAHIGSVLRATAGLVPAFEIVDSRYVDWKFAVGDMIADNVCYASFVLGGPMVCPEGLDLRTLGMILEVNGELATTAAGAEVLGHPARSVAWLANRLSRHGQKLRAGDVVLSGSLTKAWEVRADDYFQATFGSLGTVGAKFL